MIDMYLVLIVRGGICQNHGVYYWVGRVGLICGKDGGVDLRIHDYSNVTVVSSSLWHWVGHHVGV